jgi:hypothetical protein
MKNNVPLLFGISQALGVDLISTIDSEINNIKIPKGKDYYKSGDSQKKKDKRLTKMNRNS